MRSGYAFLVTILGFCLAPSALGQFRFPVAGPSEAVLKQHRIYVAKKCGTYGAGPADNDPTQIVFDGSNLLPPTRVATSAAVIESQSQNCPVRLPGVTVANSASISAALSTPPRLTGNVIDGATGTTFFTPSTPIQVSASISYTASIQPGYLIKTFFDGIRARGAWIFQNCQLRVDTESKLSGTAQLPACASNSSFPPGLTIRRTLSEPSSVTMLTFFQIRAYDTDIEIAIFSDYSLQGLEVPAPELTDSVVTDSFPGCKAPESASMKSIAHPAASRSAQLAPYPPFVATAGSTAPAKAILTLSCAGSICNTNVSLVAKTDDGGDWLTVTPAAGVVTGTTPLNITVAADASKLKAENSPYTAQLTFAGNFLTSPAQRQIVFNVMPPCNPKVEISSPYPAAGETIWTAPVKRPRFEAEVRYDAPADGEVTLLLFNEAGLISPFPKKVKAGSGVLKFTIPESEPAAVETVLYLEAVLQYKFPDVEEPGSAKSAQVQYVVAPAPEIKSKGGCAILGLGLEFQDFDYYTENSNAVTLGCRPALHLTLDFKGRDARMSINRLLTWGIQPRGGGLLPPELLTAGPYDMVVPLESSSSKVPKNADHYLTRVQLRNEQTLQLALGDPVILPIEALHILECKPTANSVIDVVDQQIECRVEYSTQNQPRDLVREIQDASAAGKRNFTTVGTIDSETSGILKDQFAFRDVPVGLSSTTLAYALVAPGSRDLRPTGRAGERVTFFRLAQSLDSTVKLIGRDKVSTFVRGRLTFLDGLGLPGTLGKNIKTAADICSGKLGGNLTTILVNVAAAAAQKADCAAKMVAALRAYRDGVLNSADKGDRSAGSAPENLQLLGTSWSFDTPQPKNGSFSAKLTLEYSADELPDGVDFDESQLQIVSWDPTAGVFEILPTTVDRSARTGTAQLDLLAPAYALARIAPSTKTILRSPLVLTGRGLVSGLALDNLGTSEAKFALAAFASDGTVSGDPASRPVPTAAASAQTGGIAASLLGAPGENPPEWLEISADGAMNNGVQLLAGSNLIEVLPLETALDNTWVLSLVEQNDNYTTQIHIANSAKSPAEVQCDLRGPDGKSAGTWNGSLDPKGKVELTLTAMFPELQLPFQGYLSVSASQNITVAAVINSDGALVASAGKVLPTGSANGRLYAPQVGGTGMSTRLNLVNFDTLEAPVTIRAFQPNGAPAPATNVKIAPLGQYSVDLAQIFGTGPLSLQIESPKATLLGDVTLSDASGFDRFRTALPLSTSPQLSLLIPFVVNDGSTFTRLTLSSFATKPAVTKVTLVAPDGTPAAKGTVNLAANASWAGSLGALLSANAAGGYLTIESDQPITAMAILDPQRMDIAAVAAVLTPGAPDFSIPRIPAISVAQSTLSFGSVTVGQRKSLTLAIGNTGSGPLTISSLAISNAQFNTASVTTPFTVDPAAQRIVTIEYAPTAAAAHSATFTIASNDPARASVTVALSGTGVPPPAPSISIAPISLDFGTVSVGQSKDLTLTIQNNGGTALSIISVSSSNLRFAATPAITTALSVAPGASLPVTIRFSPTAAGAQTATLTVTSNDLVKGPVLLNLLGTGAASTATRDATLLADDGTYETSVGYTTGAANATFVNRLTPPAYPATLKSIQIYFGNSSDELPVNYPITILAATNPNGSATINGIPFQRFNVAVGATGKLNMLTLTTPITITSGDFVVGFATNNPPNFYPMAVDATPPFRQRSYISADGATFSQVNDLNFAIRAVVSVPAP